MSKKDPLDISGIEEIRLVEPSDWISRHAKMRADAMRRRAEYDAAQDLARASLRYGAGLTERDVAARLERADKIADRGLLLAIVGLAVGAGGLIVFVRDLMTAMGVL